MTKFHGRLVISGWVCRHQTASRDFVHDKQEISKGFGILIGKERPYLHVCLGSYFYVHEEGDGKKGGQALEDGVSGSTGK